MISTSMLDENVRNGCFARKAINMMITDYCKYWDLT